MCERVCVCAHVFMKSISGSTDQENPVGNLRHLLDGSCSIELDVRFLSELCTCLGRLTLFF